MGSKQIPQFPAPPELLCAESLSALGWLRHGFTTRRGGVSTVYGRPDDLNLGQTPEDCLETVQQNRRIALQAVAADTADAPWILTHTRQIHSTTLLTLPADAPHPTSPADGLITLTTGLMLAVLAADCVPILLADSRQRVIAAVHAGWRGTVGGIARLAVQSMQSTFGTDPRDVLAAIGPSIGPCCYPVGEEVATRVHEAFHDASDLLVASHLNLWEANRRQLLVTGLPPANITLLRACTACSLYQGTARFFSHRAQQGRTGRMMGLIGIVPHPVAS